MKSQNGIVGSISRAAWLNARQAKLNGEFIPKSNFELLIWINSGFLKVRVPMLRFNWFLNPGASNWPEIIFLICVKVLLTNVRPLVYLYNLFMHWASLIFSLFSAPESIWSFKPAFFPFFSLNLFDSYPPQDTCIRLQISVYKREKKNIAILFPNQRSTSSTSRIQWQSNLLI